MWDLLAMAVCVQAPFSCNQLLPQNGRIIHCLHLKTGNTGTKSGKMYSTKLEMRRITPERIKFPKSFRSGTNGWSWASRWAVSRLEGRTRTCTSLLAAGHLLFRAMLAQPGRYSQFFFLFVQLFIMHVCCSSCTRYHGVCSWHQPLWPSELSAQHDSVSQV